MNSNATNVSGAQTDGPTKSDIIFWIYYYGIFFLITCVNIPGNVMVLCTVCKHPKLRQPCNYYIASLAFADLLVAAVYPLYNISHLQVAGVSQVLGTWSVCRFIVTQVLALEICSSYHLVAITITRYIAIVHPLRYHLYVTNRSTCLTIAGIWFFSIGVCVVLYTIYNPMEYGGVCRYELIFSVVHVGILLVIQLVLPLCIMFVLYSRIVKIARQQAQVMALQVPSDPDHVNRNHHNVISSELKSTVMVSILLGCFTLAWTPMIIYFFASVLCTACHINRYIRASVRILLYMNSAVNVFIYAGRLSDFREHIGGELRSCCGLCCRIPVWTCCRCKRGRSSSPRVRVNDRSPRKRVDDQSANDSNGTIGLYHTSFV